MSEKQYAIYDKAWQPIVGCQPSMKCAPRCWARKAVARIVECQRKDCSIRSDFFQQTLTPDGREWSGKVFLDWEHINDPSRWRKPATVALGFHGDIAYLSGVDLDEILKVVRCCPRHQFFALTKQPNLLWDNLYGAIRPENLWIGCSVTGQGDADAYVGTMRKFAKFKWKTHCWNEPALGPIDWDGWEFLNHLVIGGESGSQARLFDAQWARDGAVWGSTHKVPTFVKQMGSNPYDNGEKMYLSNRKGADPSEWPEDVRMRQAPEVVK